MLDRHRTAAIAMQSMRPRLGTVAARELAAERMLALGQDLLGQIAVADIEVATEARVAGTAAEDSACPGPRDCQRVRPGIPGVAAWERLAADTAARTAAAGIAETDPQVPATEAADN